VLASLVVAGCGDDERPAAPFTPVPRDEGDGLASVGPPLFATENTTRINGADAIVDAAGVALAARPPGGGKRPAAVTLIDSDDWAGAIAASSLAAPPVRAPVLYSTADSLPDATQGALAVLDPAGSDATERTQVFAAPDVAVPGTVRVERFEGSDPAGLADSIDRVRGRLADQPEPAHLLVASLDDPGFAMPAASWAARSGDPVLFTNRDAVPEATVRALRRHRGLPVYVLGPKEVVSKAAMGQIRRASGLVTRIKAKDDGPVAFAVEFARYVDQDFGWDINDPGHGMAIANLSRPGDAGAAAVLSAGGKWGPLLLTDGAQTLPPQLEQYLLDLKPGYVEDPTRAVYNHAFLMGDESAIAAGIQGRIDELLELAPVRRGTAP
jgi:hypothetical protein